MGNLTFDSDISPESMAYNLVHEIIFILFAAVGLCADATITYTIFHFQRLRTLRNVLIANWAIADMASLIFAPSGYRLTSIIPDSSASPELLCVFYEWGAIFHIAVLLFAILVSGDWLFAAYFPSVSEMIRKRYMYIIWFKWTVVLASCAVTFVKCLHMKYTSVFGLLSYVYLGLLSLTLTLQLSRAVRRCMKEPSNYAPFQLNLTTAFALSWLVAAMAFFVHATLQTHYIVDTIGQCLIFGSSVINFVMLYYFDRDFQACVIQAFRRHGAKYEATIPEIP